MSGEQLTKKELLTQMERCWHLYSLPESKINQQAYVQLREIVEEHFGLKSWTCTSREYYALPEPIRNYIAGLETNADPPSMVRENIFYKEMITALERKNELLIQTIEAQQKPIVTREWMEKTIREIERALEPIHAEMILEERLLDYGIKMENPRIDIKVKE